MDVLMPQLGETVTEGTVTAWHKKVGDRVEANEPLFDVSTDKVDTEVPAPAAGVLQEILVAEGETVRVGARLGVIAGAAEAAATPAAAGAPAAASAPSPRPLSRARPAPARSANRDPEGRPLSPVVRRLLAEHGLRPEQIGGTGADGRIRRNDVLAFVRSGARPASAQGATAAAEERRVVRFDRLRKLTAEHMVRSKATSPHVLQAVEADFHAVEKARAAVQDGWRAREGFGLSYLPFVAWAVCRAIADFPRVNAHVEGESVVEFRRVHLAIAVDLDHEGLVAPVIRDAGQMPVRDLAHAIREVSVRARSGALGPDELTGGTYTISNSGTFGTLITAPIINQPQVAILSTDGVRKRPVVIEGPDGDSIAIRPVGILAQSFDHRAIDGAYSAAFLRRLREIIEQTDWSAKL